jgi:hypothetical protein
MKFKQMYLNVNERWQPQPGSISGSITFEGDNGDIKINVSQAAGERILALVAEGMIEETRKLATAMQSEIMSSVRGALEHKPVAAEDATTEQPQAAPTAE